MADVFARMRQIIGTPADWASNNIILASGEVGVERGPSVTKLKVGDGVQAWSALPYIAGDADITAVTTNPGSGLTGGATSGNVVLAVDWTLVAPLLSPALTGTPTTPNVAPATLSNTTIANTAFVQGAISAALTGVYAPLNSPLFTGDPRTTTDPPIDDADRSIPSTKWVTDYFLKLKGGALTGPVTNTSTYISAASYVQATRFDASVGGDSMVRWISTGNAANTRRWQSRHKIDNVLRFARTSDADVELVTLDFMPEGSIFQAFSVPQARNDGTVATTNWISLKLNDYLSKSVGGVVTGDVTFTGGSAFAPVAGKFMTVPVTPLNSVANNIPATPAWVRDLLLTRTGTVAKYILSATGDADVDPTSGKITIEVLPDEIVEGVTFAVRRIAMSTTDMQGQERYLLMLQPGDALVITDDVDTPPITAFARYVITDKPVPTPPPPALPQDAVWVKFDCYRIEQRGALPTQGDTLVVTGFLNTATGDGPIIAINAGVNLSINETGGATGASGVVTIDMDPKINLQGVLIDWNGMIGAAALPIDPLDIGPFNNTVGGGRARWRGAPTTGTTDMVMDIADDFFRWISYPKGTSAGATTLGTINLIGGNLNWRGTVTAGGVASPAPVPGAASIQAGALANSAGVWAVGADGFLGAMGVYDKTTGHYGAYITSAAGYASLAGINNVGNHTVEFARFNGPDTSVNFIGAVGVGHGTVPTSQLDVRGNSSGTVNISLYNAQNAGGVNFSMAVADRSVSRVLSYSSQYLQEAASVGILTRYSDFDTHIFRNGAGVEQARFAANVATFASADGSNGLLAFADNTNGWVRATKVGSALVLGAANSGVVGIVPASVYPLNDAVTSLGQSGNRWSQIYSVNALLFQAGAGAVTIPLRLANSSTNPGTGTGISFDPSGNGIGVRDAQIRAHTTASGGTLAQLDFLTANSAAPAVVMSLFPNRNVLLYGELLHFAGTAAGNASIRTGGGTVLSVRNGNNTAEGSLTFQTEAVGTNNEFGATTRYVRQNALCLYSEHISTAGQTTLNVTIPAGAKRVELEYYCYPATISDQNLDLYAMVGGNPVTSGVYTYQYLQGTGTLTAATYQTGQNQMRLGGAAYFRAVLRLWLVPGGTYALEGTGYGQSAAGARTAISYAIDGGVPSNTISGFRLQFGTGTPFAVGSTLRCSAMM